MWKWLNKLLKNKEDDGINMENSNDVKDEVSAIISGNLSTSQPKKRKHKLEIQLYEADYEDVPDGQPPRWRPVNMGRDNGKPIVVEVADKKELLELQQRYALCDQKMKIIREIDPFDDNAPAAKHASANIPQNNQAIPVQAPNAETSVQVQALQAAPLPQPQQQVVVQHTRQKPKIVTIGDMQVKYDGDKVYQRQWVKLNSNEASNFRVVNDANNKIVSLNGKHIECKKWVIVEEDNNELEDDVVSLVSEE